MLHFFLHAHTYSYFRTLTYLLEWGFVRSRIVMSGPNALETRQYKSTLGCAVIGIVLGIMFIVGVLMHFSQGGMIIAVAAVIVAICTMPFLYSSLQLYKRIPEDIYDNPHDDIDRGGEGEAPNLQAWASYIITKPKIWYCWFRFIAATVILFLWPLITKYASGMPKSGTFFLIAGLISWCRINLDAGSVIREYGTLSSIDLGKGRRMDGNTELPESECKAKAMIVRARASETMVSKALLAVQKLA